MYANRDLQEYEELIKSRDNPISYFFKKTSPEALIALVGLIIIAIWFVSSSKINPYIALGIVAAIVIVIIIQLNKSKEKDVIPLPQIRLIALSLIERSVGSVYPVGTHVTLGKYAKLMREGLYGQEFKPYTWYIGILIRKPNGLREEIRVGINCYSGMVESVSPAYAGFDALDIKDKQIVIPTNEFQLQPVKK